MILTNSTIVVAPSPRIDRHRLAGSVTVDGSPTQKQIAVFDRVSFELLATCYSDPTTGDWELFGMYEYPEKSLLVVALDNSETYNAEVADYVSQGQDIF